MENKENDEICEVKFSKIVQYKNLQTEGIRRILESEIGTKFSGKIETSRIDWIRMGTTVATNALLEQKGERMALVVNEGFEDVLFIGKSVRLEAIYSRYKGVNIFIEIKLACLRAKTFLRFLVIIYNYNDGLMVFYLYSERFPFQVKDSINGYLAMFLYTQTK